MLTDPTAVSPAARVALDRFETAFENARSEGHAGRRIYGGELLRRAKEALPATDFALLDLVVGRGRTFADIAQRTGRKAHDLRLQFAGAAERLARHFESVAEAP